MKKIVVVVLLISCPLMITGCTPFFAGTAAGAAGSATVMGVKADLDAQKAAYIADYNAALVKLKTAADDANRAAIQAYATNLAQKINTISTAQAAINTGLNAATTNWADPNQVMPWASSLLLAIFGAWQTKTKMDATTLLTAVNEGVEKYKALAQPDQATALYEAIKERKLVNGVS